MIVVSSLSLIADNLLSEKLFLKFILFDIYGCILHRPFLKLHTSSKRNKKKYLCNLNCYATWVADTAKAFRGWYAPAW